MSKFSKDEKKKYMFRKHIREHLFEYVLDIIGPMILTWLLLYLCKAEEIFIGIIVSFFYSLGKVVYSIYHYKKEYVDVDIK